MKQMIIANAYKTITKFDNEQLPLDISYKLYKVKKALQDQWDFQIKEEEKIFDKYHPQVESGKYIFDTKEDEENFAKEIIALANLEIDLDFNKVSIGFGDRLKLSINEIDALNEFIDFES